jgi:hypothetical protein
MFCSFFSSVGGVTAKLNVKGENERERERERERGIENERARETHSELIDQQRSGEKKTMTNCKFHYINLSSCSINASHIASSQSVSVSWQTLVHTEQQAKLVNVNAFSSKKKKACDCFRKKTRRLLKKPN